MSRKRPHIIQYAPSTLSSRHTHYERRHRPLKSTVTVNLPDAETHFLTPLANNLPSHVDTLDDDRIEQVECEGQEREIHGLALDLHPDSVDRKRLRTQGDHPLLSWIGHIDNYLTEFLRLEGRGNARIQVKCATETCEAPSDMAFVGHRCEDCQDCSLYCLPCTLKIHQRLPFHRIHKWNGLFFEKVMLKSLGLRLQLGHLNGVCSLPQPSFNNDFVVIDIDGIHQVAIDYCGCQQSLPKTVQLLWARLFPSTVIDPKTAATFHVLETFQMLSFTSKVSAFEFYQALARRTDNTGTSAPLDRYHGFRRMIREWRHIRLLKRSGRGHDPSGSRGTKEGECAVLCPACPIPGINLPPDWKERPTTKQWLYALFIGIDANFRLKRMNVSSDERDPGLNHGYAYIIEHQNFEKYLDTYGEQIPDDKSSCNNHDAIKSASMRGGKGTAASGIGTVECSRHDMKRPTAVGDLQKGERYINMDYFLLSTLRHHDHKRLVISYDIVCQWSRNLLARCELYPKNRISASPEPEILFLVPKFHLPAHIAACQIKYSFNLTPGVGRTDGEAPERGWSAVNAVATSTREMGPGSRRDTLDDHFGDYNWRKISAIADTFLRKAEEAIKARQEHVEAFVEFNAALPEDSTKAWMRLCQEWERDSSNENPFRVVQTSASDSEVRLRLAQDDARAIESGTRQVVHNHVAPGLFIYHGLEFEELQRRLALDMAELGCHATSLQQAKILERSNALRCRIDAWIEIQHLYIPQLASVRAAADQEGGGKPPAVHDIELYLPSRIHAFVRCDIILLQYEWELRYAQAHGSLNNLRGLLLMESMMFKSKERHSRGQHQQTRSVKLLKRVRSRIDAAAAKYRLIRSSLQSLARPLHQFKWSDILRVLEDDDMSTLTSLDNDTSEGRKKLKWIWTVQGTGANADESTQSALRVEWCKARARAHRWQEECLLLHEEMRRVLATFAWQSENWTTIARRLEATELTSSQSFPALVQADITTQAVIQEGKIAYAYRQAAIRYDMLKECKLRWEKCQTELLTLEGFNAEVMVECH